MHIYYLCMLSFVLQSCDLLKATIKYLNDRVLFIITSPPLPWKGNESPHNAGKLSTPPNVKTLRGEYNTRLLDIEENESEVLIHNIVYDMGFEMR